MEGSRLGTSGPVESEAETLERRETGSRDDAHSGEQCRPRKTRSGRNSRGWRGSRTSTQGSQKGHPPADTQGRVIRGVTSTPTHVTIQTLPASANRRGRSPPTTKVAGDHWRLGETAHLPEVSLFERFLSRARGVRPNRSTRTRRGLARRGGPTYSVIESFRDFWGCPIADLHYSSSESVRGISARGVRTRMRTPYMSTRVSAREDSGSPRLERQRGRCARDEIDLHIHL